MITSLKMSNVGPAPKMELEFGRRLNLLTGDNGLGKSFLLDIAWWAMTRNWPADINPKLTSGKVALPTDKKQKAHIDFSFSALSKNKDYTSVTSRCKSRIKNGNLFFIINPKRIDYEEIQGYPDPRRTAATGCP